MRLYTHKNTFLKLIFNLQFLSCLYQLNGLLIIPNWHFLCLGKMFLYLINLLYLFFIKLFSQSETSFTNDEHKILSRLSFIIALFDLF